MPMKHYTDGGDLDGIVPDDGWRERIEQLSDALAMTCEAAGVPITIIVGDPLGPSAAKSGPAQLAERIAECAVLKAHVSTLETNLQHTRARLDAEHRARSAVEAQNNELACRVSELRAALREQREGAQDV